MEVGLASPRLDLPRPHVRTGGATKKAPRLLLPSCKPWQSMRPDAVRRDVLGGLLSVSLCRQLASTSPVSAASTTSAAVPVFGESKLLPPLATFGVQIYDDASAERYTRQALDAGFRSFFTSPEAGNQLGFARAIRDGGVPREQLFIAGSVLSDDAEGGRAGRRRTTIACDESRRTLAEGGVESLDLLLLERPGGDARTIRGQWRALQEQRAAGWTRGLAVCNFDVGQIDVLDEAPLLNQLPFSLGVRMPHDAVLRSHQQRGVALQAWGPLGGPFNQFSQEVWAACAAIATRRGVTKEQVALRWIAQQGVGICVHSRCVVTVRLERKIAFAQSFRTAALNATLFVRMIDAPATHPTCHRSTPEHLRQALAACNGGGGLQLTENEMARLRTLFL